MKEWTGVAAVAGRRIDAADAAEAHFPSSAVSVVAGDIRRLLLRHRVGTVVASAACGADIVALEVAIELGLRLVIVLPFAPSRFRAASVVDRGGDWGARFDAVLNRTDVSREIIQLAANVGSDDLAYAQATRRIVSEALERSPHESPLAIAIWEGKARSGTDATKDFLDQAAASGMRVRPIISTLGEAARRYLAGEEAAPEHALDVRDQLLLSDPVRANQLTREVARRFLHEHLELNEETIDRLWRACKQVEAFGLARRILRRRSAGLSPLEEANLSPLTLATKLRQQQALCTSKDPDLSAAMRHDWALQILDPERHPRDQEQQGIAGGIYKRRWEWDGSRASLELALRHYRRGLPDRPPAGQPAKFSDAGYVEINCAFVLDLLASLVQDAATSERYRLEAREIRGALSELTTDDKWSRATRAEAYLGLERCSEAQAALARYMEAKPDPWELDTTLRQLVRLAHLRGISDAALRPVIAEALKGASAAADSSALTSLLLGRVGLALSGGGFRASLYHLGVLARLAECGLLRHVEVLSCVSGGSIVGALYYLKLKEALETRGEALTLDDYLRIVEDVIDVFRAGVGRNLRTGVLTQFRSSLAIISGDDRGYAAAMASALQRAFYRGASAKFMGDLQVSPKEGPAHFHPGQHNWTRKNKVPTLVLNAATLNTGHSWQFSARSMGESPFSLQTAVDSNARLRRVNYGSQAERSVLMSQAVAASACVPGLFAPMQLDDLYDGYSVRLVDGGVFDNQGSSSLLEQDCQVLLVSDAAGQLFAETSARGGHVSPLLRSVGIFQERIRQTGFEGLMKRKEAGQVRHVVFTHLTQGLGVPAVDWKNCEDPLQDGDQFPSDANGHGHEPQVEHELQRCLAKMRTDLDIFSEIECAALMASGYLSVRGPLEPLLAQLRGLADADVSHAPHVFWFSELLPLLQAPDKQSSQYRRLLQHLDAGARGIGRSLELDQQLKSIALGVGAVLVLVVVWLVYQFRDVALWTVGGLALSAFVLGLRQFAGKIGNWLGNTIDFVTNPGGVVKAPVYRYLVAFVLTSVALIVIKYFDPRYLERGSLAALRGEERA